MKTLRLVTLSQYNRLSLACIRSWGWQGFTVGMVCIHNPGDQYPRSRYLSDYVLLPEDDLHKDSGISIIAKFLEAFQADAFICMGHLWRPEKIACWIHDNKHKFPAKTACCLPPKDVTLNLLSKNRQVQAARKAGLSVLPTYLIDTPNFNESAIQQGHYPLCIRPTERGSIDPDFKVKLMNTSQELRSFINDIKIFAGPIIAQPFINLPNVNIHGSRTFDGRVLGMQAFLVERKFEGISLVVRPYTVPSEFIDKCIVLINIMQVVGPFDIEFLYDNIPNKYYFLEMNNRFGSSTAKIFACGYDEPLYALNAFGYNQKKPSKSIKNAVSTSKMLLLKYLFYALNGRLSPLDYPQENTGKRVLNTIIGMIMWEDDVICLSDFSGTLGIYKAGFAKVRHREKI